VINITYYILQFLDYQFEDCLTTVKLLVLLFFAYEKSLLGNRFSDVLLHIEKMMNFERENYAKSHRHNIGSL
jgi:hypothetical protein